MRQECRRKSLFCFSSQGSDSIGQYRFQHPQRSYPPRTRTASLSNLAGAEYVLSCLIFSNSVAMSARLMAMNCFCWLDAA